MKTMTAWWQMLAAALLLATFSVNADDTGLGPAELADKVAKTILQDLEVNRASYRKEPRKLREMVDKIMLPYFDAPYAGQLILAKHWRTASEEQRKRFIDGCISSILANFGEAFLDFTPDRLKILPFQGKADAETATVKSEVRRDNGSRVPVNYSLRKTADGWKMYDVTVEGISYVKSLRTDYGKEIEQKGLDSLIQRLEKDSRSGIVTKPSASGAAAS
jgi:phospholipid transport system substrate-binding protein